MNLESNRQSASAHRKLGLIEEQVKKARERVDTPENRESLEALMRMANQLREEITRFESRQKRQAS
jgi:hypothetical protein